MPFTRCERAKSCLCTSKLGLVSIVDAVIPLGERERVPLRVDRSYLDVQTHPGRLHSLPRGMQGTPGLYDRDGATPTQLRVMETGLESLGSEQGICNVDRNPAMRSDESCRALQYYCCCSRQKVGETLCLRPRSCQDLGSSRVSSLLLLRKMLKIQRSHKNQDHYY